MIEHAATFTAAFVGLVVLYGVLGRSALGPDADYWEPLRTRLIPILDRALRSVGGYAEMESYGREYAGTIHADPEQVEIMLYEQGYHRNPLSSLKTLAADKSHDASVGSWAYRESQHAVVPNCLALRQTHVTLYRQSGPDGQHTALYAHNEYSSINPFVAWLHYRGKGADVAAGVEQVREQFAEIEIEPPRHLEANQTTYP
jgi:hypothetical protein